MERDQILKYIQENTSPQETREIEKWIRSSKENTQKFNILKARYLATTFEETSKIINIGKSLEEYKRVLDQDTIAKRKRIWVETLKYAAMIVVVFGLATIYQVNTSDTSPIVSIPENTITLKLGNGDIKTIDDDGTTRVVDSHGNIVGTQHGNRIIYNNESRVEKLIYNILTVPYGKRFDIILSDSTRIFLNAGSSLKYPIKFIKGQNREVYLSGEAFFEVAKNENPFIVNTNELDIMVLGTSFNVTSYPEDNTTNTVLVEGSVALYQDEDQDSNRKTLLTPGHLASLNKTNMEITIEKSETFLFTAWKNGNIVFRHTTFNEIIKKLERHYDITIINNNKVLGQELFTASFENPSLEHVLNTFEDNYGIEYIIDNKKITINP